MDFCYWIICTQMFKKIKLKFQLNLIEFRQLISGQFAVSYIAFFFSRFGIFFAIQTENDLGFPLRSALIFTFAAESARLIILVFADRTYLSNRSQIPARLRVVIITWLVSAFGGSLIGGLVLEAIPEYEGHLTLRVIPSGLFTFAGFVVASIVVAQIHFDRLNLDQLRDQFEVTNSQQSQMFESILSEQRAREDEVREQISKGIVNLKFQIDQISDTSEDKEILRLVDKFDTYSSAVVRTLSQNLRNVLPSQALIQLPRTGFLQTLSHFLKLNNFNIAPSISVLMILGVGSIIQFPRNGFAGIIFILGLCLSMAPILSLLRLGIDRYVGGNIFERYLSILVSIFVIYTAAFLYVYLYTEFASQNLYISPQVTAFRTTISTVLISIAASFQARLKLMSDQIEESLVLNEATMTQLKFQNLRIQREFANFLHGSVQGKLASISMSLKLYMINSNNQSHKDRADWLSRAKELINNILVESDNLQQRKDINFFLTDLKNSYQGIVSIEYSYPAGVSELMDTHPEFCQDVSEIIRNGLTNAIRHGQARNVRINLHINVNKQLEISIKDDGIGPPDTITPGYGFAHIHVIDGNWTLQSMSGGGAELRISLSPK